MSKIYSAGIVLARGSGPTFKVLLGHSTGNERASFQDRRWTFLKGKQDGDETLWETAKREFEEESNFKIKDSKFESIAKKGGEPAPFFTYSLRSGDDKKIVSAFLIYDVEGLTCDFPFTCPSKIKNSDKPEIDDYTWAAPKHAKEICMPSQKDLFIHIYNLNKWL